MHRSECTALSVQALLYLDDTISELPDTLPSKRDVLRLYRGRGATPLHCSRGVGGEFTCSEPTGCLATDSRCVVASIKELWLRMRLPVVSDKLILAKLKEMEAKLQKFLKRKMCEVYAAELDKTFNLAPKNYQQLVMESDSEEEEEKARKLRILHDFVGPNATRYL